MAGKRRVLLIRAFIAIRLGESNLSAAQSAINALNSGPQGNKIRWVHVENLHVTLRFLGKLSEDRVEPLARAVGTAVADMPSFDLGLGPVEMFPRIRRPRVVVAALLPEQPVIRLAAIVESGIEAAGIPGENRVFRAHLTLGRVRRNAPRSLPGLTDQIERLNREQEAPAGTDRITQVVLFQSDLKPDGPVYMELWAVPLAAT